MTPPCVAALDVDWAKQNGAQSERFNLAQHPMALAERYPNRAELTRWTEVVQVEHLPELSVGSH